MTTTAAHERTPLTAPSSVWAAGAFGTGIGAIVATAYGVLLRAAGVPMRAGSPGATKTTAIGLPTFPEGTVILALIAIGLAWAFTRRAARPRRLFVTTTVWLTAVSLLLPLVAGATAWSTRLTFAFGHLVVAAVVIPVMARGVPETPA